MAHDSLESEEFITEPIIDHKHLHAAIGEINVDAMEHFPKCAMRSVPSMKRHYVKQNILWFIANIQDWEIRAIMIYDSDLIALDASHVLLDKKHHMFQNITCFSQ